jgi:hypothetical protein
MVRCLGVDRLLWSLGWRFSGGVIFRFHERDWPTVGGQQHSLRVLWRALLFMLLATLTMVPFLLDFSA